MRRHQPRSESVLLESEDLGREALIDDAIRIFGKRYECDLSREEAGRMLDRLTAFFGILADWDGRGREQLPAPERAA